MSDAITDAQLLRSFATSRDQRAFAELVARHKNMVFSTALRRTGHADLAADVTQHVFLALATKAAWLSTRPNIGGWLYKSTILETARRQRDEARRHARERRYAEEEMKWHPPTGSSTGEVDDDEARRARALLPHLDDALSALSEPDREAIVLRFLRGLSLRDTGTALGTTEEAARKRVSRALEKLSNAFQRRGVTATAAVLASAVLPRAVDAAPSSLGASLSGLATTAPATGPAATLFLKAAAVSKAQLVAACTLVAAAPITWQAARIHQLQAENEALLATRTAAPAHSPPAPSSSTSPPSPPLVAAAPATSAGPAASAERGPRGKWDEWRELQRQQQRESRLAALHERLGLDDTQLTVIAEATARAETTEQTIYDDARRHGLAPDPAAIEAAAQRRDQAIAAALGEDQWAEYQAFVLEEEAGRREIFANRLLADLQTSLHLSDAQKDALFAIFAAEPAGASPHAARAPIEAMDDHQTEKLAHVLTEEQFKLWRQRTEMWSNLFRRGPAPR